MKDYEVRIPFLTWVTVKVSSSSEEEDDIIDQAFEDGYLQGFAGNGGSDKLIGVSAENASVKCPDTPYESDRVQIEVEAV